MKRKFLSTILTAALLFSVNTYAYADEIQIEDTTNPYAYNEQLSTAEPSSKARALSPAWSIWTPKSKKFTEKSYGKWCFGTEGRGGKNVSINLKKSVSVSNTLTGNVKISISNAESFLGVKINKSFNSTAKYSISAPSSKKIYTINYRRVYNNYNVYQERYLMLNGKIQATDKATAKFKKFVGFGFDWTSRNR